MTEYNPYDLALGLYGREGVLNQVGRTYTAESYTVPSTPGIITIVDPDGNRCMDISNVVLEPVTPTPVGFVFTGPAAGSPIGSYVGNVFTDFEGGTLTLNPATATPTSATTVYISVEQPTTPLAGDLDGYIFHVREGATGPIQTQTFVTTQIVPFIWTLASGATITIDPTTDTGAPGPFSNTGNEPRISPVTALLTPALTQYQEGRDYIADAQELRAGVIKIKGNGLIAKGSTVLVSCYVPEKQYITVSGADAGDIEGKLLFIGDPSIGGQYNIEGWKVKVTPDGDLTGLIGTDFGTYTLQVRFITDYENHPDYPYYRATLIDRVSGDKGKKSKYDPEY
jgi:hypothetical protein